MKLKVYFLFSFYIYLILFPRLTNCRRVTQKCVGRNQQIGTKCFHFIKVLKSTIDNSHALIYSFKKNLAKLLFTPKATISKNVSPWRYMRGDLWAYKPVPSMLPLVKSTAKWVTFTNITVPLVLNYYLNRIYHKHQ